MTPTLRAIKGLHFETQKFDSAIVSIPTYNAPLSEGLEEDPLALRDFFDHENPTIPLHKATAFVTSTRGHHNFLIVHTYDQRLPHNNSTRRVRNDVKWRGNILVIQRNIGKGEGTFTDIGTQDLSAAKAALGKLLDIASAAIQQAESPFYVPFPVYVEHEIETE